ncbi:MAG: ribosomal subunit interface protein [Lentisphaerae bacterium RIFOXYB12_FULL_65_16]|nr:MAG: ribosomal subunit interface protein [Lentisphaerae bacterium RIFOXYA12_64_32]OGV88500.1 MAG: ribosomal subunit interface protein [Lentisphaerae bacterium RIFOXYB12_FULL_65_16]
MEVIISGRHYDVDEALKTFTEEKFGQLAEAYPKLTSVRVVMHTERSWNVVEAHLHGKHLVLEAKAQSREMVMSVEEVIGKLETQLRKHFEKIQHHKGGESAVAVAPGDEVALEAEKDDDQA